MPRFIRTSSLFLVLIAAAVSGGFAQGKKQEKKQTKKEPTGVIASVIRSPPEYDPVSWKEHRSALGGFSILFPGTPQEVSEKVKSGEHEIVIRLLKLQELAVYSVMYLTDPTPPAGTSEATRDRLDFSANQAIQLFQGVALQQKEITLDSHPGRFLMLRLPDGLIMRLRFYLVGGRLYQLMISTPKEEGATDDQRSFYEATANKFLDSFKLAPAATARGGSSVGVSGPVGPVAAGGGSMRGAPVSKPENLPRAPISGRVLNGKVISKPAPAYPAAAMKGRVEGVVVVDVTIDEEGKVMTAEAVGGPELLREAAVAAALRARFTPTRLDDQPVKVSGRLTYNFVLR